jgi:hypothetical protein
MVVHDQDDLGPAQIADEETALEIHPADRGVRHTVRRMAPPL